MFFVRTVLKKNGPDRNSLISFVCKTGVVLWRLNSPIFREYLKNIFDSTFDT